MRLKDTGDKTVDRAARKLASEGFILRHTNLSAAAKKVFLFVNGNHEGASITFGGKDAPVLKRGPLDSSKPEIIMPVSAYLKHWRLAA